MSGKMSNVVIDIVQNWLVQPDCPPPEEFAPWALNLWRSIMGRWKDLGDAWGAHSRPQKRISEAKSHRTPVLWLSCGANCSMLTSPPNWMCAGAESVVPVFHGASPPVAATAACASNFVLSADRKIPRFFDSKRPVLLIQHGALCCQKVILFDLTLFLRRGGERLRGF